MPYALPTATNEERRLKRQVRREQQRLANVGRATSMHAARLLWEEEAGSAPSANSATARPQVHIGCSGWFYWHWRGGFYPAELPTSAWFKHYAENFKTVELNAPFYAWPTPATVASWLRQAGRRKFVYTVKVCELITHVKKFTGTKTLVRDFSHIANLLGPRMGCFLFQLPPSFQYSRQRLNLIISQLDPSNRNVVEFRHASWWNETVFAAFRSAGIIFCSCSGPRLPNDLVKTADDIYLRFHGVKQWYRHDYTLAELKEWAEKIRASNASQVWAYFNNDRDGFAVKNARALRRLLTAPS